MFSSNKTYYPIQIVVIGVTFILIIKFLDIKPVVRILDDDHSLSYIPLRISSMEPTGRQNIFFIESSQPKDRVLRLNLRQACSIESAARQNPDSNIFLYVVEADGYLPIPQEKRMWEKLESFKNIHIKVIDAKQFTKDSPLQELFQKGLNSPPEYIKYHRSDLLRYTLLWKYPGTYLDLDVISQKPLKSLGYNYAIAQSNNPDFIEAGAGIINFDEDILGRNISRIILNDLAKNFHGWLWDDSSVRVLSRAITAICHGGKSRELNAAKCQGFQLYPLNTFYAVSFGDNALLLEEKHYTRAMTIVNKSIGIHVWNKLTADKRLNKTQNIAMVELARRNCPDTFSVTSVYF